MAVILNLAQRHAKLVNRPKCGFEWESVYAWPTEMHLHRCKRIKNHANPEHECACCATRSKRRKA